MCFPMKTSQNTKETWFLRPLPPRTYEKSTENVQRITHWVPGCTSPWYRWLLPPVQAIQRHQRRSFPMFSYAFIFFKIMFLMFFPLESVLDPPGWLPAGPPGSIYKSNKNFKTSIFWTIFSYLTLGQP